VGVSLNHCGSRFDPRVHFIEASFPKAGSKVRRKDVVIRPKSAVRCKAKVVRSREQFSSLLPLVERIEWGELSHYSEQSEQSA
jgi:hypothetical protein